MYFKNWRAVWMGKCNVKDGRESRGEGCVVCATTVM